MCVCAWGGGVVGEGLGEGERIRGFVGEGWLSMGEGERIQEGEKEKGSRRGVVGEMVVG